MDAIERQNPSLRGVLPKIYVDPELNKQRLGELIDLIGTIGFSDGHRAKDSAGRVYEYFLGQFADAEGKKGGQFYTPASIVRLMVEMLEPYKGRIYDGRLRLRRHVPSRAKSSSNSIRAASATFPSTGRKATPPRCASPR